MDHSGQPGAQCPSRIHLCAGADRPRHCCCWRRISSPLRWRASSSRAASSRRRPAVRWSGSDFAIRSTIVPRPSISATTSRSSRAPGSCTVRLPTASTTFCRAAATAWPMTTCSTRCKATVATPKVSPLFGGLRIWDANPKIVDKLRDVGALLHAEKITHSYMHCWRHRTPIIYRATTQWFAGMGEVPGYRGVKPGSALARTLRSPASRRRSSFRRGASRGCTE